MPAAKSSKAFVCLPKYDSTLPYPLEEKFSKRMLIFQVNSDGTILARDPSAGEVKAILEKLLK